MTAMNPREENGRSLFWWKINSRNNHELSQEIPAQTAVVAATAAAGAPGDRLPGSPCFTYLKSPVVVERNFGERTGLLPSSRNEPRAVRQVKQCQLAVVVLVSILTAVVIFFVSGYHVRARGSD